MLRSFDADGEHFAFRSVDTGPDAGRTVVEIEQGPLGPTATIANAHLLFNADFNRAGSDLVLTGDDGKTAIIHQYFASEKRATLLSAEGASISPEVVDALAGPLAPGQYAQATPAEINAQAVGRVAAVSGNATILRNGVAVTVNAGDAVLKGDVLQTGNGTIGVTFNDSSTLNLTANSRLVVNEFVYDPNGTNNSQLLSLVQGSLTLLSGQVAHTGDMKVDTPVATMGIRGTFAGITRASDGAVQVWVNQSQNGIEATDHQGVLVGTITQDGPMLVFHASGPLQVIAQEVGRGPQQIATELAALQAIIATQTIGQRFIDQFFNPNNPNPQSTDHAHTQIDLLIQSNLQYAFNGVGGNANGGSIDPLKIQLTTTKLVDTTPVEVITEQFVLPPQTNLPPVVFSPPPEQVPPSNEGPVIFANQEVSVFDPDTDVLTVTLTSVQGTSSLSGIQGLTFTEGDGTDDALMMFSGTQAAINAALNGLEFTPAPNAGHHASLEIQASDGASTTTQTINFTTDAPPVLALNYVDIAADQFDSASYNGNDGHVNWASDWTELNDNGSATSGEFFVTQDPAGSGFSLKLSDLDSEVGVPDTVQRTVDLSNAIPNSATLEFDYRRDIPNGETNDRFLVLISNDNGQTFTEIGQIGATGNGSFVDGGYQHFSYTIPTQYLTANTIFRFSVGDDVDGNNGNNVDVVYVDNVKVTYNFPANYVEHGPGVPVADGAFNITDPDDTTLQSATVTLTNPHLNDLLSVDGALPGGITASYDATNHVLTLTGQASLAAYQTALHQVEFSNTGDNPDTADRDIAITVNDGLLNSNTVHTTIHVAQVNDPPVIFDNSEDTDDTPEDTTLHLVAPNDPSPGGERVFVSDPDAGNDPILVTFQVQHGTLSLPTLPPELFALVSDVTGEDTGTVSFRASVATINTLIHDYGVFFTPDHNFNGNTNFVFTVNDEGNNGVGGPLSDDTTVVITVGAVNDPPVIQDNPASDHTKHTSEDTQLVVKADPDVVVTDPDAGNDPLLVSLTVQNGTLAFTSLPQSLLDQVEIVDGNGSDGSLSFRASLAVIDTLIHQYGVIFTPNQNFNGNTNFVFNVNDEGHNGAGPAGSDERTIVVNVGAVNDPPVLEPVSPTPTAETEAANASAQIINQTGNLAVQDGDVGDTLTAKIIGTSVKLDGNPFVLPGGAAALIAAGALTFGNTATSDGNTQIIHWTYNPAAANLDFLGQGHTLSIDYELAVGDGTTDSNHQHLILSVVGTDDGPVTSAVTLAAIAEDSGARTITQAELLANASDVDGPSLSAVNLQIAGGAGALHDNLNGTWNYTPASNDDTSVSFSYQVTDGTLNAAGSATLDITPVNDPPNVSSGSVAVSEEGLLPSGVPDAVGNPSDTTNSAFASGDLTASDAEGSALTWTLGTPGAPLTSGGQTVQWGLSNGNKTLVGSVGSGPATPILTVTIDNSGHYTVTLNGPIDHPSAGSEDVKSIDIPINVFDGSATTPATLTVNIEDDSPAADLTTASIAPTDSKTNVMVILDLSGSMATGAPGLVGLTRLDVAKAAVNELLEQYGNRGEVMVRLVTFASSAAAIGSVWMTVDQAKAALAGLNTLDSTNYDAALLTAMSAFASNDKLDVNDPATKNVSYFLSDGEPTVGTSWGPGDPASSGISTGGAFNEQAVWQTFLTDNKIISYAIGVGSGVSTGDLAPIAFDPAPGTQLADTPIVVTDLNQLSSTLVFSIPPVDGAFVAVSGGVQGNFGGDGGHMQSITVDNVIYAFDPTAHTITTSGSGTPHFTFDGSNTLTVDTDPSVPGGELSIVMTTGAFTFQPTQNFTSKSIGYTLVDGDGDTASNTVQFTASGGNDHAPIVRDDHVITNITGGSGTAISIPSFALLVNDTDADGNPIAVTATSGPSDGSVSPGSGSPINAVTFTDNDSDGGTFTYTGSTASPVASDTGIVSVDRGQANLNTLTGTDFGEVFVARNAATTINANGGNDALIGGTANDTLNGGAGNDLMFGGGGGDAMDGGSGSDTFVFTAVSESHSGSGNFDNVSNFTHNVDHIDFSAIAGLNDSVQSVPVGNGSGNPFIFPAHSIFISSDGVNTTVYANSTGLPTTADVEIHLNNVTGITSGDFILHH